MEEFMKNQRCGCTSMDDNQMKRGAAWMEAKSNLRQWHTELASVTLKDKEMLIKA